MSPSKEFLPGALCRWDAPAGGRRVLLGASVVRDLQARAIEGFVALPKRGVEVGGLLYGHAGSPAIRVEGFEEIPCEHRYGPSYALSEGDREKLSEILDQRRNGGSLPVIGFYRSFTARDPLLEAADEEFVKKHFPSGDFLMLMLQPLSARRCVASFRFFLEGELQPEVEAEPFAFDPAQMGCLEPVATRVESKDTPRPSEPPAEPPVQTDRVALPPPYRLRLETPRWTQEIPKPRRSPKWWTSVAAVLLAGVGSAAIYQLWLQARAPRWAELHLDARPTGGQVQVSWDASAPEAAGATKGLLSVADGNTHHDISLTPAELRSGKYAYTPSHSDLAVRLMLYDKGIGISGDAVRLTSASSLPKAAAQSAPVPAPPPASSQPAGPEAAHSSNPVPAPVETAAAGSNKPVPAISPTTIHEVQPIVPDGVRTRIQDRIVIPVEVQINERGRVTGATAESPGEDGVHRYLADLAQKAARQWRFNAARSKTGVRMSSSKTVYFIFTP